MDDRGRLAQPLKRSAPARPVLAATGSARPHAPARARRFGAKWSLPRGAGFAAVFALFAASIGYGVHKGDHAATLADSLRETRDGLANAAGFRIASVSLTGNKQVTREEIFSAAGISDSASTLFFDVEGARARIKAIPWVADATVRKLLPDRLDITVRERNAFALWQRDGKVSVIAADGSVVSAQPDRSFAALPFVVGRGAEKNAQAFIGLLDGHPSIRNQVRAAILVAERRWNLRLHNGVDVRLPESDVARALQRLADLDRDKKLLTRDIAVIDLRIADRVAVRLSEAAAQARDEAMKERKQKRKGGDA